MSNVMLAEKARAEAESVNGSGMRQGRVSSYAETIVDDQEDYEDNGIFGPMMM